MTKDELNAIEKRLRATTPAPWKARLERAEATDPEILAKVANSDFSLLFHSGTEEMDTQNGWAKAEKSQPWADAQFIAHSRDDIERLLAEARYLRATRTEVVRHLRDECDCRDRPSCLRLLDEALSRDIGAAG